MKVEIINPDSIKSLYRNHGVFACSCYNTPEEFAERVGKSCEKSGHMSGSRCEYIKFRISEIDRGTAEQCLRHEIGVSVPYEMQDNYSFADYSELVKDVSPDQIVKNMASFRYIDKSGFKWETPKTIRECPNALAIYEELMQLINDYREDIIEELEEAGVNSKTAIQDSNFVLPRATTTEFIIGFTPEALIHFCHKRLCVRAQEFIRELAILIKNEVKKYSEEFSEELQPQCKHLLWCPEGKQSCRAYPTKSELKRQLEGLGK